MRMVALLRLVAPVLFNTVRWPPFGHAHPGGRAPLWSGRAPSKAWNLLEIVQIRPLCLLLVIFRSQMHNETLQGGNLPL